MKYTIDSIKIQVFRGFDVWIMDGNSSKETQDYLATLKAPFFYQSEKDKGIYDAMNKGISVSKGDWIYFIGAGDVLESKNILSLISNNLNEDIDVLYGNIRYDKTIFNSKFSSLLWIKNTLHHQSIFYNRKLFFKTKYNTGYKVLSDYDFNLKLFCAKIKVKKIDTIISNCNMDGISKQYDWSLYKEEFKLKFSQTKFFFYPFLFLLVIFKFIFRKF